MPDFRGRDWSGRDGRNVNSNLPAGYREPTDAEVEAVMSGLRLTCPECGNDIEGDGAQHPDGRWCCCADCLDNLMWKEAVERKAWAQIALYRHAAAQAEVRTYRTIGRFQVATLLAVGGWLTAIMLAFGWGRW